MSDVVIEVDSLLMKYRLGLLGTSTLLQMPNGLNKPNQNSEERRELDHYEDLELLMNLARARAQQLLLHGFPLSKPQL